MNALVLGQVAIAAQPARSHLIRRPHALTQAIAQIGDSLVNAAVGLGHAPPATDAGRAPAPAHAQLIPRNSSSDGLTSVQVGIIVGCLLGTLVLGLLLYFCVATTRRRAAYVQDIYRDRSYTSSYYYTESGTTESGIDPQSPPPPQPQPNPPRPAGPSRTAWPSWKSIPPPVVPTYRAKAPSRKWTADPRSSTTHGRH